MQNKEALAGGATVDCAIGDGACPVTLSLKDGGTVSFNIAGSKGSGKIKK
jgi:hypothetical protein